MDVSPATNPAGPGVRVVLDEARIQYAAVRGTVDAYNTRVAWLVTYLGVLIVAVASFAPSADVTIVRGAVAVTVIADISALGFLWWAARPRELTGPNLDVLQDHVASEDEYAVMAEAVSLIREAIAHDGSEDGALREQEQAFRWASCGVAIATAATALTLAVGVWFS